MNFIKKLLKQTPEEPLLILDIGTRNAKAGIVKQVMHHSPDNTDIHLEDDKTSLAQTPLNSNIHLEILGASKQQHGQTSFRGLLPYQLDAVLETCSLAVEKTSLEAEVNPSSAVILAGGTVKTVQTKIKLNRADPEAEITEKELDHIFEKIEKRVDETSRKKAHRLLSPTKTTDNLNDVHRINMYASMFHVDSQLLESPLGFTGTELKISLIEHFCLKSMHGVFERIAQNLSLDIIEFVSPAAAAAHIPMDHFADGIVIDVGGNLTEVAVFTENDITSSIHFNWGGNHLTWNIMRTLDVPFDKAEKISTSLANKELPTETQQAADTVTKEWLSILMSGIEESLSFLQKKKEPFPENFFLTGGGSLTAHLKSACIAYPWTKNLSFRAFPKPHRLNPAKSEQVLGKVSQVNGPMYAPLIGAAFGHVKHTH